MSSHISKWHANAITCCLLLPSFCWEKCICISGCVCAVCLLFMLISTMPSPCHDMEMALCMSM